MDLHRQSARVAGTHRARFIATLDHNAKLGHIKLRVVDETGNLMVTTVQLG